MLIVSHLACEPKPQRQFGPHRTGNESPEQRNWNAVIEPLIS